MRRGGGGLGRRGGTWGLQTISDCSERDRYWDNDSPISGFDLPVSGIVDIGMILSVNAASPWKRLRFLTTSLEKSLVPYWPSMIGWINGCQSLEQTERKLRMSRAAPWPRESHTAPQNRDQSHIASSSVSAGSESAGTGEVLGDLGWRESGEAETMDKT